MNPLARHEANRLNAARPQRGASEDPSIVADAQRIVTSYVQFLWHHRRLFVTLPLLFVAIAAGLTLTKPRVYRGQLTVAVSRGSDDSEMVVASFRPYLENHRILDEVLKEFKLDQPPFSLTRTSLLRDHYSVDAIRNTNLVTVRLRLGDPELLAKVLNRIGERAVELVRQTSAELGQQAQLVLKTELDEAAARMHEADHALQTFKEANQIALVRRDVDALLEQRGALLNLSVRIGEERSRLAQAEADLKTHARIEDLSRTIEGDQLITEAARQRQGGTSSSLAGLTLRSQYANPVYEQIAADAARSRADLAALEAQRRQLIEARHINADQLPLLSKLYAAERALAQLEMRQAIAHSAYKEIANKYELARLRALDRNAQLTIIDPALPPDVPEPRGLLVSAVLGLFAGFLLAVVLIVFQQPAALTIERPEVC